VYMWDLDHGFAGVVLIKKAGDGSQMIKGCWDSIHVIEVQVLMDTLYSLMAISQENHVSQLPIYFHSQFVVTVASFRIRPKLFIPFSLLARLPYIRELLT